MLRKPIKTRLFIGGILDGQQKELLPYISENRVVFPVLPEYSPLDMSSDMAQARQEEYRRETLRARESLWDVWVQKDITIEQALELLLLNYRPKGKG